MPLTHNVRMKRSTKASQKPSSSHVCAAAGGCREPGDYKAPLSRWQTGEYQYLCLTHIREFNKAWDYFDGWGREAIEDFMHTAPHGHRPTWKIGAQPLFTSDRLRESFFKMLGEEPPSRTHKLTPKRTRREREALAALDLEPGAGLDLVKAQYKKLVKKYHPDVNAGKATEESFKLITNAYSYLSKIYGKSDEE